MKVKKPPAELAEGTDLIEETSAAAIHLSKMADELQLLVQTFKV